MYNSDRKRTCRRTSAAERLRLFSDFRFSMNGPPKQSEFINEVLLFTRGKEESGGAGFNVSDLSGMIIGKGRISEASRRLFDFNGEQ